MILNNTSLRQLGWDDFFADRLAQMAGKGGNVARIISVQRNRFLVSDGEMEWLCTAAGKLLHSEDGVYPVTGDWVLVKDTVVQDVVPRKNMLSRGAAGSRGSRTGYSQREQAIAANIDTVFVVCGLDRDFNVRRVERYLTLVYNCGLVPVIVLTKSDLQESPELYCAELESIAFGVPIIMSSSCDGSGRSELEGHLGVGRTIAMLGSSGAGKSTLANILFGSDIQATGAVSDSVGKGRHHTTSRELIRMPQGGMLMDNPGIREIAFFEDGSGVETAFPDLEALAGMCRFSDCTHTIEPGCAVVHAVEAGELKADRLESYRKMKREMEYLSARQSKSANRVEKERWKNVALMVKDLKKRKR